MVGSMRSFCSIGPPAGATASSAHGRRGRRLANAPLAPAGAQSGGAHRHPSAVDGCFRRVLPWAAKQLSTSFSLIKIMDATLHALGGILLKAVPTFRLVLALHFYLKSIFFKPLEKVLGQRYEEIGRASCRERV